MRRRSSHLADRGLRRRLSACRELCPDIVAVGHRGQAREDVSQVGERVNAAAPGSYTVVAGGKPDPVTGVVPTGLAMVELYDADASAPTARLINMSNRGYVGTGANIMIPGFIVSNEGSRTFLIRAVGPSLASFGVTGVLADPQLAIFRQSDVILANDNWDGIAGSSNTASVAAQVGAFPLGAASKDAAFVVTLPPGAYTVQASGVAGTTGVALVEVYLVP